MKLLPRMDCKRLADAGFEFQFPILEPALRDLYK
ncbi:MAG: DUF1731 domain-containing protein [Planctomycetales bacterium]|nr:DUF1731 domain-containing protein [Planctomycetales bacterium]